MEGDIEWTEDKSSGRNHHRRRFLALGLGESRLCLQRTNSRGGYRSEPCGFLPIIYGSDRRGAFGSLVY